MWFVGGKKTLPHLRSRGLLGEGRVHAAAHAGVRRDVGLEEADGAEGATAGDGALVAGQGAGALAAPAMAVGVAEGGGAGARDLVGADADDGAVARVQGRDGVGRPPRRPDPAHRQHRHGHQPRAGHPRERVPEGGVDDLEGLVRHELHCR